MKSYLQLMRPANLVTAIADIFAGLVIAKFGFSADITSIQTVVLLCVSTVGLYGGGVVLNDVFDADLDAVERPERAIPSGRVTLLNAKILGVFLLLIGILASFFVSSISGMISISVAVLSVVYDKFGKHQVFLGPINMGLCRGGNLLLGMSVITTSLSGSCLLAFIPIIYIAAITMISRGEVHGGSKFTLYFAGVLYLIVSIFQLNIANQYGTLMFTLPIVILHLWLIFKPLIHAIQSPIGPNIGKAVKAGVLALIIMDAAWVSLSGNVFFIIGVLLLLPLSFWLAKTFAVT